MSPIINKVKKFLKNPIRVKSSAISRNITPYPILDESFLDVHYHYDNNGYINGWKDLMHSNPTLWDDALNKRTNKKILIATLGGGFSHRPFMTIDNILSIALTLRGAQVENFYCDHSLPVCLKAELAYIKPEVILNSQISQTLCKGCYKDIYSTSLQLGLPYHTISEFISLSERQIIKDISKQIPIESVKDYELDGISIGKHAIAGAMRYFSHSEPSQVPLGDEILRTYLEASILSYNAFKKLLQQNKYDSVCLTHGTYTPHGIIKETCEKLNIPVVSWTVAYLNKRFIFTYGEILHSMLHEPNDLWENFTWSTNHENKIMNYLNSRWSGAKDWLSIPKNTTRIPFTEFAKANQIDLNKPIIGLLTNIIWESYAEYKSRIFPNMLEWIKETIQYFGQRKDLQLLIRIHPAENHWHISKQLAIDEIKKMFAILPKNIFIINSNENISTYEAMEYCNAAIIYQTQTGLELAAQGIPVIATGDAFVKNKGIVYEPSNETEYFAELSKLPFRNRLSQDRIHKARKYAYHAFFRKMIPLSFFEESSDWMLYKSTLTNLEELLPNKDPGLDIICEGIMNEGSFIYPAENYSQEGAI